jgi:hypothetical protein
MCPTATASDKARGLQTALAAYQADFALMPPSLQPGAYELVESDLQAIRCLVDGATPEVKEGWRRLVNAHILLTDAMLENFLAMSMGHGQPASEEELTRLREAHAAAVSALGAMK